MSGGLASCYEDRAVEEEKERKKVKTKLLKKLKSKKGLSVLIESFAHHASFALTSSFTTGNFTLKSIARDILDE